MDKPNAYGDALQIVDFLKRLIDERLDAAFERHQRQRATLDTEPGPAGDFLTRTEAARFLKISAGSIDNYRRSGRLEAHRFGKSVRFRRADLENLAQKGNR